MKANSVRRDPSVSWGVRRRDDGWVAVVFLNENPITFNPPTTKSEARRIARDRAAEYRAKRAFEGELR